MEFYVYILISIKKSNWSYVGSTSNLIQRIKDHNSGKTKSTRGYRPLRLVYWEEYKTKKEAYDRELYLKSGIGREEKQIIIIKYSRVV
ncbi:MAG: GIY-YIG nuclease family protein [Patescibacteria group bacterium]